ncbi:MAG: 3-isopropylmalate dehydratase large subunit [Thermoflexus hugenholtzii]|jgi:3-isopropylmalate/(R)-2-methylmalate dehydratase large subunit|uniref:3-isopropylmalate dehydratase large subunit n=1 Tax=Thermoflexus TaxID=1495649 RepID=UPI001C769738|nr:MULTISPECIES: 3-isopropylmalate dehydratase large subunit [Thermoflexus]QWK11946.1 MAG: 3-isopropylmalate dehydratase large subunit [Thermoflexus hugenholtzii]
MSGRTFAQKAIARAAGLPDAAVGQIVDVRPDLILSHDNTAAIAAMFYRLGLKRVRDPDRLAITLDHAVPPPTPRHAQNHAEIRRFVAEQGIRNFFEAGRGICHQVLSEEALVLPGQMILGADSHTTHFGWMGAFGAGVGRSEVLALWATGEIWLRVPESIRIVLTGRLPPGVTTKDLCLRIFRDLGADGGLYRSVEFAGEGVRHLSIESRMGIANFMAEFGVKNAYLPPDDRVFDWLAPRRARRTGEPIEAVRERIAAGALYPDPDAPYEAEYVYCLEDLEPMVACPHSVDHVRPLREVAGTRIDMAFIGTCTNGRLEDIAAAAEILRGRRIAPGVRLLVIPASREVLEEALRRGFIQTLVEAGAMIGVPGCGPCMGNHMGIPAPGEIVISSGSRNFRGRMGTPDAEIYLASPAVVAASALRGVITDPREITSGKTDAQGAE